MSDLTERERKTILAKVLVKFDSEYGKGLSEDPEKIKQWFHQIGHLSEEVALATADACVSHYKWQPKISEFLEISRQIRRHQESMAQQGPKKIDAHLKALQEKGLNVQRALLNSRATQPLHDHTSGWEGCPVCAQASAECNADECRTCMALEDCGLDPVHFKG